MSATERLEVALDRQVLPTSFSEQTGQHGAAAIHRSVQHLPSGKGVNRMGVNRMCARRDGVFDGVERQTARQALRHGRHVGELAQKGLPQKGWITAPMTDVILRQSLKVAGSPQSRTLQRRGIHMSCWAKPREPPPEGQKPPRMRKA
jgi:hypothetical protein